MEVQTVPVTINPGKETKEIIDAAFDVIATAIGPNKKEMNAYLAKFTNILEAAKDAEQVDDEFKSEYRADTVAYTVYKAQKMFVK